MIVSVLSGQPLKSGIQVVAGSVDVGTLVQRATIPYRDAVKKEGYQRHPQETRVNKFASELKRGNTDVPTSILVNVRGRPKLIAHPNCKDLYSLDLNEDILNDGKIYIVDGQHRFLAFKKLFKEDPERWGKYKLQFVMLIGASETEEMNQFYIVNTTAKSVRTDLALDLLKQRAELDGKVMDDLISQGQDWKVKAQSVCERMNSDSPVWQSRIRLANAEKARTVIPASSFVSSLKKALTGSPFFKKVTEEQLVKMLNAYWSGIRASLREPFDNNPNDYALQKGIGVTAMHEILPIVTEVIRSRGGSVFDSESYEEVMRPVLAQLSGDNTAGENVSGAHFWLTAPRGGAAGSYSSSAGKRVLYAKLVSLLPEIDLE